MNQKTIKQKKVLVGTVSEKNSVSLEYSFSLVESVKAALNQNTVISAKLYDSEGNTTMKINQLITLAWREKVDSLLLVSPDASWSPQSMMAVVNSKTEVVALPVCGINGFLVGFDDIRKITKKKETGEMKVNRANLNFFKLGAEALRSLCETSPDIIYEEENVKAVIGGADIFSSYAANDALLFDRLRECGYGVWVNPNHTVQTNTIYRSQGDFLAVMGKALGE